jgi:hypothetical protein
MGISTGTMAYMGGGGGGGSLAIGDPVAGSNSNQLLYTDGGNTLQNFPSNADEFGNLTIDGNLTLDPGANMIVESGYITVNSGNVDVTGAIMCTNISSYQIASLGTGTTIAAGPALGTGGTATLESNSNDFAGLIKLICTGGGSGNSAVFTVTFATPYAIPPKAIAINPTAPNSQLLLTFYVDSTINSFTVHWDSIASLPANTYGVSYIVIE